MLPNLFDVGGVMRPRAGRAGQERPREPAAREAIFVVHPRLVKEVGEVALVVRRAVPEEDEVRSPHDGDRGVFRRHVHYEPVSHAPGDRRRGGEHGVDHVEGRQIDDAGVRARVGAERLVFLDRRPAREGHDELLAGASAGVGRRCHLDARHEADLCVLDRERRGFPHLPADQLLQVSRARRDLLEPHERHFGDHIGHDESDAPGPPDLIEDAPERGDDRLAVLDVRRRQGRHERPFRQRLGRVGGDDGRAPTTFERCGGHVPGRQLDGRTGTGRVAKQRQEAHSTNVTLLISLSVVVPSRTRSTADSRRNRMPSSRAAFLISEVGRFSRIISRM